MLNGNSEEKFYNAKSEAAILGAIIKNNKLFYETKSSLHERFFYSSVHAKIYSTITELIDKEASFDTDVLKAKLQSLNILDDIGGVEYLNEVTSSACWDKALPQHCEIIEDLFLRRETIKICQDYTNLLDNENNEDFLKKVTSNLISDVTSILNVNSENSGLVSIKEATNSLFQRKAGRKIRTGIKEIDKKFPLRAGEVAILGGRPSHGKTAVACSIAEGAAREGSRVDYHSLEMSKESLSARILSSVLFDNDEKIPYFKIIDEEEYNSLAEKQKIAIDEFQKRIPEISINDSASQTVSDIISTTLSSSNVKEKPDLLIIDYLDLIPFTDIKGDFRHDVLIGKIVHRLRQFAKDHDCSILLLVQLNREVERLSHGRPNSSHLRNSGEIEQHADKIMFVFKKSRHMLKQTAEEDMTAENYAEYIYQKGKIEIICDKQRNGMTGSIILNCDISCNYISDKEIRDF